jgi:hypothetical protein
VDDDCYTDGSSPERAPFTGTSAATPITCGYFGLLFEMWHEQAFCGFGGGASVFDSRPHMTTAKALMINTAHRYPLSGEDPNSDFTRANHGWGRVDVERLYNLRNNLFIVDESQILDLNPGTFFSPSEIEYEVLVDSNEDQFNVTLVYADPAAPALCNPCVTNDLNLQVEYLDCENPPCVEDTYWGNCGLLGSSASSSGCTQANHPYPLSPTVEIKDTVENVFVPDPPPGKWAIRVSVDEICVDPETCDGHVMYVDNDPTRCCADPEGCVIPSPIDVDFALVASGVSDRRACCPAGFGDCEDKTRADCAQSGGLFLCKQFCSMVGPRCPAQRGPSP